jgi:nitrogen fixation NifU-like protein
MEEQMYKENILEHYKNPQNKGMPEFFNLEGKGINPSCGDMLEVFLLSEEDKIREAMFDGAGCAISVAGASMFTEHVKGKTLDEVKNIKKEKMYELLGIEISPAREKCALLSYRAVMEAVK